MLFSPLAYLGWGRCGLQGEGSSGVGVEEGAGILILKSLRSVLALEGSPAWDVLAMGGDPVVFLSVGGASFLFGPEVSCIIVQVPMDADPDLAAVDEISLDWGPLRGDLISWVQLGGFKAADAPLALECLDGCLGGLAVNGFFYSGPSGADLAF